MKVAVGVLHAEDKPGVGRAIAKVGSERYGGEASLAPRFSALSLRSDALDLALSAAQVADTVSKLSLLDQRRDRLLKSLYFMLSALALLTDEEPEVAASAAALVAYWFPKGLEITRLRFPEESTAIRGIGKSASEADLAADVERTGSGRILGPLAGAQAAFDEESANRAPAVQQAGDLREAVKDAEERWDAAFEGFVSEVKERWPRGSAERTKALADLLDPVKDAVALLRASATRKKGPGPTDGPVTPT